MRGARVAAMVVAAALAAALLSGCGGGSSDTGSTTTAVGAAPAQCKKPPVTIDLRAAGSMPAGSTTFEVTDAVARRVAILPGSMAFDASTLSGLESSAKVTPLAAYTLYLADFHVSHADLAGAGRAAPTAGTGDTIGALTLIPTDKGGFQEGDVVTDGKLGYTTNTPYAPLDLTVYGAGAGKPQPHTDVSGQATIVQLSATTICVDFDVTIDDDSGPVYTAKGTVLAPVVRAADALFYT